VALRTRLSFDKLYESAPKIWLGVALSSAAVAVCATLTAIDLSRSPQHPLAKPARVALRPAIAATPAAAPAVQPQTFEQLTPAQAEAINEAIPTSPTPGPAASPFTLTDVSPTDRARALTCLTMAVYYEAASESAEGQAAVAQVILNRVRNPLFPKSVCGVVFQGSQLPTGCQFTFTCDGSLERTPSADGWKRAQAVAERALTGYVAKQVGEATHYHTVWVVPYWQPTVLKLTRIGAHIFYRWRGAVGLPEAFHAQYAGDELAPPMLKGVAYVGALAPPAPVAPAVVHEAQAAPQAPAPEPIQAALASAPEQLSSLPSDVKPGPPSYFGHSERSTERLPIR
jgi:spore germination cell wall hydrolase CwlJ-like protein